MDRNFWPDGDDGAYPEPVMRYLGFLLGAGALVLFLLVTGRGMAETPGGGRVALVIGNSGYEFAPPLRNPVNDTADVAAALSRLGFAVTRHVDLDYRQMRLVLRDFADVAQDSEIALVYFAGHGIEVDKSNFLIPVDAELQSDLDVEFEAIPLDRVLRSVSLSSGLRIVMVDACRNNPFSRGMTRTVATRSSGTGLARVDPVGGVLVSYAAREGTLALDGQGRNSPYALALLKHLEEPGLEIGKLFRRVRDTVFAMTNGRQEPFTYGSLPGTDIYLKPPAPTLTGHPVPGVPGNDELIADYAEAARLNTLKHWTAFIKAHGADVGNALVQIAIQRRDTLRKEEASRDARRNREPWLVPKAGLPDHGPVELNREERLLVQTGLIFMGFDPGPADGAFGPKTRAAIAAARLSVGLSTGTHVDRNLLLALPDVPATRALQSDRARKYSDIELPDYIDPRLLKALTEAGTSQLRFGYFRGHLYLAVLAHGHGAWYSSNAIARKMGGHLATISSAEENRFLYDLFMPDERFIRNGDGYLHGPIFGLVQIDRSNEPSGGWAWVTGEPLGYTNWSRGNPDNFRGLQQYGSFFRSTGDRNRYSGPITWDDTSGYTAGYLIEIE